MKFNRTISAILREPWIIQEDYAIAQLPIISKILNGEQIAAFDDDASSQEEPMRVEENFIAGHEITIATKSRGYQNFDDAPAGSIARISIDDVLMKHDSCGWPGSMSWANWVAEADSSQNIIATYIELDCPGGSVYGTQTLSNAIKNHQKPIICHVNDGIAASGGYWVGAAGDKLYASQPTDAFGSIGTYISFWDFKEYFENKGYKFHEIYAPQSTDKNSPMREALNGNYEPMKERLKEITDVFINSVKSNRTVNTSTENPFTGKMFQASKAHAIGLCDGVRTQQEVLEELVINAKQNIYV